MAKLGIFFTILKTMKREINIKNKVAGLIPSRLNSSRLFAKALMEIDGLPLVVHTYKRALLANHLDDLYICTDSSKIASVAKKHNCKVIKTGNNLTGTDRISEAADKLKEKFDLYVDIQGDEPLIDPRHIDNVIIWHLKNLNFDIIVPSLKTKRVNSPHVVKIVKSKKKILYFSRAEIPFEFKNNNQYYYKHLSVISFKPESLKKFKQFKESKLEKIEGIELMRALENDMSIGTFELKGNSFSVDTKLDFQKAQKTMINDKYRKKY